MAAREAATFFLLRISRERYHFRSTIWIFIGSISKQAHLDLQLFVRGTFPNLIRIDF